MLNISRINLPTTLYGRVSGYIQSPLYRNGYALVLSTLLTSGIGLLYWLVAARLYSAEVVGLNAGLIAAMNFISYLAQLNLNNAINRFLPTAGGTTSRLIGYSYLITLVLALLGSSLYLLQIAWWTPLLSTIQQHPWLSLWFVLSTAVWAIVGLQDSALTGLRQATWVLYEQTIFAVLKLILLVALASFLPNWGIFVSWTLSFFCLPLPINWLLFRRLVPRHINATPLLAEPITLRQIAHFLSGDYVASLIWIATTGLLPVIVLERAGAEANASFYLTWTLAWPLYLVSRNMGMSLITEGAREQAQLNRYSYQTIVRSATLLVPVVLVILLTAPYLLQFFGKAYAQDGARLLCWLAVGSLPYSITSAYISMARIHRWLLALFVVQATPCLAVLGLGSLLLDRYGVVGIGVAWTVGHWVIALILSTTVLRSFWLEQIDIQPLLRWTSYLREIGQGWQSQRQIAQVKAHLPTIRTGIANGQAAQGTIAGGEWQIDQHIPTSGDIQVFSLSRGRAEPTAMLKLADSLNANRNLIVQATMLNQLDQMPCLESWRRVAPRLLATGMTHGGGNGGGQEQVYCVEERLSGLSLRDLMNRPPAKPSTLHLQPMFAAFATIGHFHQQTGDWRRVDAACLQQWVEQPIQVLRNLFAISQQPTTKQCQLKQNESHLLVAVERIRAELHEGLTGKSLFCSWIHGDFAPGNVLLSLDGSTVTGVIDWELSSPLGLPEIDLFLMLISLRMQQQQRELGDVVEALLAGEGWNTNEQALLKASCFAHPANRLPHRTLLLLTWLHHVSHNLTKSTKFAKHTLWLAKNVYPILRAV